MGACLDLARCRGIADKVGSHRSVPKLVYPMLLWEPLQRRWVLASGWPASPHPGWAAAGGWL